MRWPEGVLSATLTMAAAVIAATAAYREFWPQNTRPPPLRETRAPEYIPTWQDLTTHGIRMGPKDAPVQIVTFADLECPFCARFHRAVRNEMTSAPGKVGLVFVHFPLRGHRFAIRAARAVECGRTPGEIERLIDEVFAQQDSLGLKPWTAYAEEAGVRDTVAFASCVLNEGEVPRITRGRAVGESIGVMATPTVIINGWRYSKPPTPEELRDLVGKMIAGHWVAPTDSLRE